MRRGTVAAPLVRHGRLLALLTGFVLVASVVSGCARPVRQEEASPADRPATATATEGELTIAIAGMVTPDEGLAYYQDLSRYVSGKVGKKLHLFHKAEYAEVNEMLKARKIDLAFVCSGPYVTGHEDFGMELLAAPEVDGKTSYNSYIIVRKDSRARTIADLKGKSFAFTDPESNTGRIFPVFMLWQMGTTPEKFFKRTFYTYSHDVSIRDVAEGKADAAAVDSLIYQYTLREEPELTSKVKIIYRSPAFGIPPVVVHPDMDPALKARLRKAFLDADKDPRGREILANMEIDRFVGIDDASYDSIRQMMSWIDSRD